VADRSSSRRARFLLTLGISVAIPIIAVPSLGLAAPKPTTAEVERRVSALYHQAEQATERYNDARIALQDAERVLAQAQRRAASQQAEVTSLQQAVGVFAATAYRSGGVDQTLQLVFSDDPQQFIDRAASLDALSVREASALRRTIESRQELRADQLNAAQQLAAVERARKDLAAQKAAVEGKLRAARTLLNTLKAQERARFTARASRSSSSSSRSSAPTPSYNGPASGRAAVAVKYAYAQLGDAYVWGASGPNAFDCSGLTMMAWRAAGVSLPHSSRQQYSSGRHVSRSSLQPGDLVFFYSPISHVGIYVGGGNMIHAPNPSERVMISPIAEMPYSGAVRP
jgi:peptidoglycan DL-endopeptidase CwlO